MGPDDSLWRAVSDLNPLRAIHELGLSDHLETESFDSRRIALIVRGSSAFSLTPERGEMGHVCHCQR